MHDFVSFNSQISPSLDAHISAISAASLYGKGVFTTLAIFHSKPFLWEKHWRRLNDHASRLGIALSNFSEGDVLTSLAALIKRNGVSECKCRITFFDESSSEFWQNSKLSGTSLLIQTADFSNRKESFSITISPHTVNASSPVQGVKSCNYLENTFALKAAKEMGFDEAIRVNEKNHIVSGCTSNIFWREAGNDALFTPSLKTGCLEGTIRELVLEKFQVYEVEKNVSEVVECAETLFLTSSGIRVVPVSDVNREIKLKPDIEAIARVVALELAKLKDV